MAQSTGIPAFRAQRIGPLRWCLLAIWAGASFGTCYFARDLQGGAHDSSRAYEWAGQGLLIVFIAVVLVNAMAPGRRNAHEAGTDAGG